MTDVTIEATDGGRFSAYVATPPGTGAAPGMLVIQEIFGVNRTVRDICDDYARRGYVALAPDLFWRQEPGLELDAKKDWDKALSLYKGFSETTGIADLISSLAWLRAHPRSNGKVGVVGYCLGGKLAFLMATRSDADAAIGYYGVNIESGLGEVAAIAKPLMLHIAENDSFVPVEAQQRIRQTLEKVAPATVHSYPGAEHAFARSGGAHYDPTAAELADRRTADFFDRHLKS